MANRNTTREQKTADRAPAASLRSRALAALLAVSVTVAVGAAAVRAGSCRVLVALGSLDIEPSPAGIALRVGGVWEFDNLVQVATGLSYNLLLVRGDKFVRLRYPDGAFGGEVTGLGARLDAGLDGSDILQVEAVGITQPGARFVSIEAQRLEATSPVIPGDGPLSVVAYLVLDGDYVSPIISNVLTRPLLLTSATPNGDTAPGDGTFAAPPGDSSTGGALPSDGPAATLPSTGALR